MIALTSPFQDFPWEAICWLNLLLWQRLATVATFIFFFDCVCVVHSLCVFTCVLVHPSRHQVSFLITLHLICWGGAYHSTLNTIVLASLASLLAPGTTLSMSFMLGLQTSTTNLFHFCVSSGAQNCGPHTCPASTWTTGPSPQPSFFLFWKRGLVIQLRLA